MGQGQRSEDNIAEHSTYFMALRLPRCPFLPSNFCHNLFLLFSFLSLFVPRPLGGALACPGCFIQSVCPHYGLSSAVAYFRTTSTSRSADKTTCFSCCDTFIACNMAQKDKGWCQLDSASRTRCSASQLVMLVQKRSHR